MVVGRMPQMAAGMVGRVLSQRWRVGYGLEVVTGSSSRARRSWEIRQQQPPCQDIRNHCRCMHCKCGRTLAKAGMRG